MLIIFFLIFLVIILFKIIDHIKKPVIIFYSKYTLAQFLKEDKDNYYKNLNKYNLQLRNINDKEEYLKNIETKLYNCTKKEQKIIKNAIIKANNNLKKIKYIGFDNSNLQYLPWYIGCAEYDYEFGLPHTRDKIIILNRNNIYDKDLYKTLIHERIHIYQRLFPDNLIEFLNYYNFQKNSKQSDLDRANPDTDDFLYKQNNLLYECKIYPNSKNVFCTQNSSKYEHPYELMAYEISDLAD